MIYEAIVSDEILKKKLKMLNNVYVYNTQKYLHILIVLRASGLKATSSEA